MSCYNMLIMQTNRMSWPIRLFLTAISIFLIVVLTLYFSGAWKPSTVEKPVATSTTIENGTDADGMDDEHEFLQADYNFDGYPDQLKMLDCGATGNCSYEVELFDSVNKKYTSVPDGEMTFELTNPVVNKTEQLVCLYANSGAESYHLVIYRYSNSTKSFVQVKEFSGSSEKLHLCSLK